MNQEKNIKNKLIVFNRLLLKTRWYYITAIVITGALSKFANPEMAANQNFSAPLMFGIIICGYLLNAVYYLYFRSAGKRSLSAVRVMSAVQICVDMALVILIIFLAGGIISVSFLYFSYAIIASGFFYGLAGILTVTSIVSFLYGGLIWGQYFDLIPYLSRYNSAFEVHLAHNLSAVLPVTFTIIVSYYVIGIFVNAFAKSITEKETQILAERDKEEAIISNLVDGLIYVNNNGRVDMLNKRAEKLLDVRAAKIVGRNLKNINYKKYRIMNQLMNKPEGKGGEMVPEDKPDSVYKILAAAIRDKDGKTIGNIKIIRDISREKFMEKMKSEFITIAGHQLRTPLSAIKGALFLLESGDYGKLNKEQKKMISQTYEYTERLINIVNDLLNVSSIEEGRYDYDFEPVDINNLLRELGERYSTEAEVRNVVLSTNIVNTLSKVELDEYKIKLALGCIISNAITYSQEHSEVKITAEFPDKDKVIISIQDNGIGIPEKSVKKVFAKFFRADNALKFNTEGNGLDLFVAKNIIDNHEGKIWFESKEGKGTTFFVELPAKQSEENKNK